MMFNVPGCTPKALSSGGLYKKIKILEEAENPEIDRQADDQQAAPPDGTARILEPQAYGIVYEGRDKNQGKEAPVPICVEIVAGRQEPYLPRPVGAQGTKSGQDHRKEDKEFQLGEYHCPCPREYLADR
jgi:hypothetical protein